MSDEYNPINSLKPQPTFGCFLYWPQSGQDWIAVDDRWVVKQLIPSSRIFRREPETVDGWNFYTYGRVGFRAGPATWHPVDQPDFERGDHVEIKSEMNQRTPAVAVIREVMWNQHLRQIEYKLVIAGSRQPRAYTADELQLLAPLGENIPTTRTRLPLREGGYLAKRATDQSGDELGFRD